MHAEIYHRLSRHLHLHPLGFPDTTTGVGLGVLEKLFTEEEAALAVELTPRAQTVEALAKRLGRELPDLLLLLDEMVRKGLILRVSEKGQGHYMMVPFMPGIWEFQVKTIDKELAEKFEEFLPELQKEIFTAEPPMLRVVPLEKVISIDIGIEPYERASHLVAQAGEKGKIGLMDCLCRKERKLLGKGCDRPRDEVCLTFSPVAEQYIEQNLAREVKVEEALKALGRGAQAGLVHSTVNLQNNPTLMCQCCSCCCPVLGSMYGLKFPQAMAKSNFTPAIDQEYCNGCAACEQACPMDALHLPDEKAAVDRERCIGCGLCALECPTGAISLKRKQETTIPPVSWLGLMTSLAREKGRTYFYK